MPNEYVLIVDDEMDLASSCQRLLESNGYRTAIATTGEEALACVRKEEPHLVLTDLKMPGMGGMTLLRQLRAEHPEVEVVMMTAYTTIEDAVEAMRLGAADFVPKPFTPDHLSIVVEKALEDRSLREENRSLKDQLSRHYSFDNIVGKSAAMVQIFESIRKIADSDINVLFGGGERDRQGADRSQHPCQQPAQGESLHTDQLRRSAGKPGGERDFRIRAGRLHGSGQVKAGTARRGPWRNFFHG